MHIFSCSYCPLTFLCFVCTGVSHCSSNSEMHILQIWVSTGKVSCLQWLSHVAFILIISFKNKPPFLLFTVKLILSARSVLRMSNSLEQWVKALKNFQLTVFIYWKLNCVSFFCPSYSPNPANTVISSQRLLVQSASAAPTQRRSMDPHRHVSSANSSAPLTVRRRAGER